MRKEHEVIEASKKVYDIEKELIRNKKIQLNEILELQLPNKTLINAHHTPNGMTAVML